MGSGSGNTISGHELQGPQARPVGGVDAFDETPINRSDIPQALLDLSNRTRANPFAWRGQFSPQLVELLLAHYAPRGGMVLDPFAGVGTVLFEAARQCLPSLGAEINPAALAMASTAVFVTQSAALREEACERARNMLSGCCLAASPLFGGAGSSEPAVAAVLGLVREHCSDPYLRNILTNVVIRLVASSDSRDAHGPLRALEQHERIIRGLPFAHCQCEAFNCDARTLPLEAGVVDVVLTSPPYINVFNYHQNNRAAMELLGWDLLRVARSEIGANRKNRGNRFLTVIQYCLDMSAALLEMRRVLKPSGRALLVLGRESNVRGVSFRNGSIVSALALGCGFTLAGRQERKFKNKFGEIIFEDILHLTPGGDPSNRRPSCDVRAFARRLLEDALDRCADVEVAQDIRAAIQGAGNVKTSPVSQTGMDSNYETIPAPAPRQA